MINVLKERRVRLHTVSAAPAPHTSPPATSNSLPSYACLFFPVHTLFCFYFYSAVSFSQFSCSFSLLVLLLLLLITLSPLTESSTVFLLFQRNFAISLDDLESIEQHQSVFPALYDRRPNTSDIKLSMNEAVCLNKWSQFP